MATAYPRKSGRCGAGKAALAAAHVAFVRCVMLTRNGTTYKGLGGIFFDERAKLATAKKRVGTPEESWLRSEARTPCRPTRPTEVFRATADPLVRS